MYLFLRNRTAAHDRQLEATAFAVDIAAKATRIVGHEISVWQTLYGAPATVLGWTMTLDSHQEMGVAREKLLADNDYVETITAAAHLFEGPTEDVLAQVVPGPQVAAATGATPRASSRPSARWAGSATRWRSVSR